jgi:hypothetical protein
MGDKMPKICKSCSIEFPFKVEINGIKKNLKSRQYCLDCSPPNSKPSIRSRKKHHLNISSKSCSICGEIKDKGSFYIKTSGNLSSYCKPCSTIKSLERETAKRKRIKDQEEANGIFKTSPNHVHSGLIKDYFEKIDSNEKAYWLGFLYADGYIISTGNSVRLKLGEKDEATLDKFISAVGADPSFKKSYGPYETSGISKEITVTNKEFVDNLKRLGCVTKKSLIIRFPELASEELNLAFLMGFYDGDGTEGRSELTCGSENFLLDICRIFKLDSAKIKKMKGNVYKLNLGAELFRRMLNSFHDSMPRKRRTHRDGQIIVGSPYINSISNKDEQAKSTKAVRKSSPKNREYIRKKKFEVTKEELQELVWSMSSIAVGKKFGVSGKAIEKRCKKLGVDKPPPGYWNKIYAGKDPNI